MKAGETIGGYRIERLIGEGGMGAVYLARHELLGRNAAVKLLLPQFCDNAEIVDRFFREAKASTAISHPGIVQIFDFGHRPDGAAYIVMEYLEGESLDARLRRLGQLTPGAANRVARQVAGALAAAHETGIVHRDLKPENIFLVPDPDVIGGERAKVLDFGIAKLTGAGDSTKTKTGAVMGTPVYMAPEQCRGAGEVDTRADIYALGCVLFHMLCGRPPFQYEGVGELFLAHIQEPVPVASRCGGPAGYDGVIANAMAKDPAARLQTMRAFSEALAQIDPSQASGASFAAAMPATGPIIASPTAHTTLGQSVGEVTRGTPTRAGGRSKKPLAIAAAAVVAVGGAVAAIALTAGGGERAAAAPPAPDAAVVATAAAVDAAPVAPADAAPPPAPTVAITIDSEPQRAQVRRTKDGPGIGFTPFRKKGLEVVDGERVYWIVKKGYEPMKVQLAGDKNESRALTLVKIKRHHRPRPRPRPKPPVDDPGAHR